MKVVIEDGYLSTVVRYGVNHANPKFPQEVIKGFKKRIAEIISAKDSTVLRKKSALHFEKLKGDREGQYSIRINLRWRIIFRIEKDEDRLEILFIEEVSHHKY